MTVSQEPRNIRPRLRWLAVWPGVGVLALLVAGWALHAVAGVPVSATVTVGAAACGGLLFFAALLAGDLADEVRQREAGQAAAWRAMYERLGRWRELVDDGRRSVARICEQIEAGERPDAPGPRPVPEQLTGEPVGDFYQVLLSEQWEVLEALARLSARRQQTAEAPQPQMEAIVTVAQRLQSLVGRALVGMDNMESGIEDPDLFDSMLKVDHLIAQIRRMAESIRVLGGSGLRQMRDEVDLASVLRQAVSEVEDFSRVRVPLLEQDVLVPGYAAASLIHLLAELAQNATEFSPDPTLVELRAELVPAGLVIEVDDRGLCMPPEQMQQLNDMLAAPDLVDAPGQLRDGRLGLPVVALLAQRYDVAVELRRNILGGTQARVVLPDALFSRVAKTRAPQPAAAPAAAQPRSADPHATAPGHTAADRIAPAASPRHALPPPTAAPAAAGRPTLPQRNATSPAASIPRPEPDPVAPAVPDGGMFGRYTRGVREITGHGAEPAGDQSG